MATAILTTVVKNVGADKAAAELALVGKAANSTGKTFGDLEGRAKKLGVATGGLGQKFSALSGLSKQAGTGIAGMSSLATVGLAAAGAAAVAFGASSVKAYEESQQAQLKLTNTLEKMPKLAGANVQAFNDQSHALQNLTGISDEETTVAQAMLGTFQLTQDQILKMTPLVADFAKKFGVDLVSASLQVGKALQGQIGALQRQGISIDKAAYSLDHFGAVQDALTQQAGGFAEAYGRTASGKADIFRGKIDDLKEAVGKGLQPALEHLVDVGIKVAGAFDVASKAANKFANLPVVKQLLGIADAADTLLGPGADTSKLFTEINGEDLLRGDLRVHPVERIGQRGGLVEQQQLRGVQGVCGEDGRPKAIARRLGRLPPGSGGLSRHGDLPGKRGCGTAWRETGAGGSFIAASQKKPGSVTSRSPRAEAGRRSACTSRCNR
jgi:hypothetical protein